MFLGSMVALVTPFRDNKIDEGAYRQLIDWHIQEGTAAIIPCGTTGESATVTHEEHKRLIEICIAQVNGRIPVIAGAGSNATAEAVALAQHAQKAGADAILSITPYYNKPTQAGLYAHYKAINDAVSCPIILYNVPSRCGVDLKDETVIRLAALKNIKGLKDATGDLERPLRLRRALGSDFCLLSGEDASTLAYLAQGGNGCISVTANIAPALCAQLQTAWHAANISTAQQLNQQLLPLHEALFVETSPAPVKYALHRLGKCENNVRLPLLPCQESTQKIVENAMLQAGIL